MIVPNSLPAIFTVVAFLDFLMMNSFSRDLIVQIGLHPIEFLSMTGCWSRIFKEIWSFAFAFKASSKGIKNLKLVVSFVLGLNLCMANSTIKVSFCFVPIELKTSGIRSNFLRNSWVMVEYFIILWHVKSFSHLYTLDIINIKYIVMTVYIYI